MGPEVIVPLGFFASVVTVALTVLRYRERARSHAMGASPLTAEVMLRLERMEQAIDAVAVEVERVSEGQRFVTRLLSERATQPAAIASAAGGPTARPDAPYHQRPAP